MTLANLGYTVHDPKDVYFFGLERSRLFQTRVVRPKFKIYVFIFDHLKLFLKCPVDAETRLVITLRNQ